MRSDFLPFAKPDLCGSELSEVQEVLESGWISTGQKTHEFEEAFAAYLGASHAVAVTSCTAAMHLALEAIGLERGEEVITTPYTFAATAEVIRYFDATPVFVEIEADTFNIDPLAVEAAIGPRTRAVLPVHVGGHPAPLEQIYDIAARYGLFVVEDAAHALPTAYWDHLVGADLDGLAPPGFPGRLACFSFYATKTLTTGEGGMVCTDRAEWAERIRLMSLHGISRDAWKRYSSEGSWFYEIQAPGYKYNMSNISAAIGLAQLRKADEMWVRRREIAERYTEAFREVPGLQPPTTRPGVRHSWHLYMLRLNLEQLRVDRQAFIEELRLQGIGSSVHFIPLHLHPYYQEAFGYLPTDFPIATAEYEREISLPIYSCMTEEDVQDVIRAVTELAYTHRRRAWRLSGRGERDPEGGVAPAGSGVGEAAEPPR